MHLKALEFAEPLLGYLLLFSFCPVKVVERTITLVLVDLRCIRLHSFTHPLIHLSIYSVAYIYKKVYQSSSKQDNYIKDVSQQVRKTRR